MVFLVHCDYLLYERYSMESRKCFLFSFFIYLTHSSYYYYSDLHGYVMQGCLSACLYTLCTIYILSACMFGLSCCTFCPMLSIDVLLQTKSPLGANKKLYLLTYFWLGKRSFFSCCLATTSHVRKTTTPCRI